MENQRATFQKTNMDDNGTIHPCFSINLTRVQIIVSIMVSLFTLFGSIAGGIVWAEKSMRRIAAEGFSEAAGEYYRNVIPERNAYYERLVALRISEHQAIAEKPFEMRLDTMSEEIARQGASILTLIEQNNHQRDVLEELLVRARNGDH